MLSKLLFVVACVAIPILWGVVVNWLFRRVKTRRQQTSVNEQAAQPERTEQPEEEAVIEYYI